MVKIGDTLYQRDGRGGFDGRAVVGETRSSWLLGDDEWPTKVAKDTMRTRGQNFGYLDWYTQEQRDALAWIAKHRHHIRDHVGACADVDKLKQIAAIIGYSEDRST